MKYDAWDQWWLLLDAESSYQFANSSTSLKTRWYVGTERSRRLFWNRWVSDRHNIRLGWKRHPIEIARILDDGTRRQRGLGFR